MGKHGGKRPRSGRKASAEAILRITISLPNCVLRELDCLRRGWKLNRSQAAAKAIRIIVAKEPFVQTIQNLNENAGSRIEYFRRGKVSNSELIKIKQRLLQGQTLEAISREPEFKNRWGTRYNPKSNYLIRALAGVIVPNSDDGSKKIIRTISCPACGEKFNFEPFKEL